MATKAKAAEPGLMTAADVAARLQVDVRTVRRWEAAGKLKARRLGRRTVRYRREDVERFIDRGAR